MTSCTISGNSADHGGGIANDGTMTITNSTISGNSAERGGGIYNYTYYSTMTVTSCTISGNTASKNSPSSPWGGGIANNGTMTVTNSLISENASDGGGGGFYNYTYYSTMTVTNCTISGNTAATFGGGIFSGIYSGIYNGDSTLTVTNCTISGNTANFGGGIYCAIHNGDDTLTVTNCTISGNTATTGGGIFNTEGTMTVTNCTISGNSAISDGGRFYHSDRGGGIHNSGTMTVTNSLISGNSATYGGGIHNYYHCPLIVTNSTIFGNSAERGDGIYYSDDYYAADYYNVYDNSFNYHDIYVTDLSPTSTLYNSIIDVIVNNTGTVQGYNNLIRYINWNGANGNNIYYNPSLPLFVDAKNGDYRLAEGSQAINKGNNEYVPAELTTDLAGNPRIIGGTVDIGAYEVQSDLVAFNGGAVTLKPDGTFRVTTGLMQNIGTAPTGEYTVAFYVSTKVPTASTVTQGTAVGSVSMSSLDAGASVRAVLDDFNAASLYSGSYYVGWAITNASGEVIKNNNAAYFKTPFEVVGIAGEPDIAASNGGAVTLKPDGTFRVTTGLIENIGTAPTGEYTVTFYVSTKVPTTSTVTQGTAIGSVTMSRLNVGASVRAVLDNFNAASLYSGNYYVGWAITNVNGEVVTNNNAAYLKTPFEVVGIAGEPDIAASNGGAVTLKPDGTFRITTGLMQNIGTAPTGEYTVTFYVSAKVPTTSTVTQGTAIGSVTMSSLNVGASVRAVLDDFNAASLYSGNYYVGWAITNVNGEVVTNNNAAYLKTPFEVVAAKAAPALTPPQTDSFTKPLPSISDFALTSLLDEGVLF